MADVAVDQIGAVNEAIAVVVNAVIAVLDLGAGGVWIAVAVSAVELAITVVIDVIIADLWHLDGAIFTGEPPPRDQR